MCIHYEMHIHLFWEHICLCLYPVRRAAGKRRVIQIKEKEKNQDCLCLMIVCGGDTTRKTGCVMSSPYFLLPLAD